MAIFTGCSGSSDSDNTPVDPIAGFEGELVILDNDYGFSDPDNDGSLATGLSLHNQNYFKILALGRVGTDLKNNGTLIAAAQLEYHGLAYLKMGINPNAADMRHVTTIATLGTPSMSSAYAGDYTDISQFPSDGCVDNSIGCGTRGDIIEVYREALINSPRKLSIITGGQLYNVAELLQAEPALFAEKVKAVYFVGRNKNVTTGQNFGGGDDYAKWALQYVINNLPATTNLIEASMVQEVTNYQNIPNSRVGSIFTQHHIQSPVAFVYGGNHPYGVGVIEGYSIIDIIPVVFAAVGNTLPNGLPLGVLKHVTFVPSSLGADVKVGTVSPNKNHFELYGPVSNWGNIRNFIESVLIAEKEPEVK